VSRSRLVPLALLVTLLLAVVAIAARGHPLGSRGGNGGALPFSFWDYLYTTIVIFAVPLLLAGIFAAAFIRRGQGKRRSSWQNVLVTLVLYSVLVALYIYGVRNLHLHPLPRHTGQHSVFGKGGQHGSHHHNQSATRTRPLQFRWNELLIVLGFLLVGGAIIAARFYPREPKSQAELVDPEALVAALDASVDDLRADADLRRAIVAAYAGMEAALGAAGIPRHPAEAPLEYLERALLSLDTSAEAVRRLTDLFEWAKFSHHDPEPSMRDEAVEALVAVRDELRASELTAA
jgi:Domain of unknown function (DUF4129)